jgi:hypothetical protein
MLFTRTAIALVTPQLPPVKAALGGENRKNNGDLFLFPVSGNLNPLLFVILTDMYPIVA